VQCPALKRRHRRYNKRPKGEAVGMSKTKTLLTVAMVAVMLAAVAGSAAFAQQPPPGQQEPPGPGIVGGSAVPDSNKYPFVAAILDNRKPGDAYDQFICGGSLIDSDSVLTAAHCVDGIFPTDTRVVVGRAKLTSKEGQMLEVGRTQIIEGYNYNTPTKGYDVAVLKLRTSVTGITPVRIPLSTENWSEQPGKVMTVAGWGSMTAAGSYPDQMQEAKVPVVSDAEGGKVFAEFDPEIMIAAGDASKSHCKGDSGGPLFATPLTLGKQPPGSAPKPRAHYQYGIASFAKLNGGKVQCGVDPAAFTEVNAPAIREFIVTKMNQ
jgi:secreted trypsin-like serine protease